MSSLGYQLQASTNSGFVLSAFVEPFDGREYDSVSCIDFHTAQTFLSGIELDNRV